MKKIKLPEIEVPDWYVCSRGDLYKHGVDGLAEEMYDKDWWSLTPEQMEVCDKAAKEFIVVPTPEVQYVSVNMHTEEYFLEYLLNYDYNGCLDQEYLFEDKAEAEICACKCNEQLARELEEVIAKTDEGVYG